MLWSVDQFHAPEGIEVHQTTAGPEIWSQSGGRIDGWVACVGTGATFLGVATALRAFNAQMVCVAVEPAGCEPLVGQPILKPQHILQGTGYGRVPSRWQEGLMDFAIAVSDKEARAWRLKLATREGLHVGFSSAANVCAAARLFQSGRLTPNAVVAPVLCDTELKY